MKNAPESFLRRVFHTLFEEGEYANSVFGSGGQLSEKRRLTVKNSRLQLPVFQV